MPDPNDILASLISGMQPQGQPQQDPSALQQQVGTAQNAQSAPVPPPPMGQQPQGNPQALSSLMEKAGPPPMVEGGTAARNPAAPPTMAGRKPNIVNLIQGMFNPAKGTPAGERAPSRTDVFENFIGQFMNSFSQGLQAAGHGPGANLRGLAAGIQAPYKQDVQEFQQQQQAQQQQSQIAEEKARTQQLTAQTAQIGKTATLNIPGIGPVTGPVKDILGLAGKTAPAEIKAGSAEKIAQIKEGVGLPVPKDIAQMIGRPELAGKMMGKGGWDGINKALTAQGKNLAVGDIGNGHVGIFNKSTGQVTKDFGEGQRLVAVKTGAQERAYWEAKFGLVPVQDENGTHYEHKIDAAGMATAQHSFDIVKGKAGLNNYKDALSRMDSSMDIMKDNTQRALVAQTLRQIGTQHDPGIISSFIGSAVSEGLDPKAADLVAATLQAREFIGANRQFAGNFQGSEALYQRMVSNVPGANVSPELARRLIKQDMDNTGRIDKLLSGFQSGKQAPAKATVAPKATSANPHGDIRFVPAKQ